MLLARSLTLGGFGLWAARVLGVKASGWPFSTRIAVRPTRLSWSDDATCQKGLQGTFSVSRASILRRLPTATTPTTTPPFPLLMLVLPDNSAGSCHALRTWQDINDGFGSARRDATAYEQSAAGLIGQNGGSPLSEIRTGRLPRSVFAASSASAAAVFALLLSFDILLRCGKVFVSAAFFGRQRHCIAVFGRWLTGALSIPAFQAEHVCRPSRCQLFLWYRLPRPMPIYRGRQQWLFPHRRIGLWRTKGGRSVSWLRSFI